MAVTAEIKEEKLEGIADSFLLFFPLFYRKILRVAGWKNRVNPINTQFQALAIVMHSGNLQTSEIGRRLGISSPNMTPLIDRLIEKGYAERLSDSQDRRVIKIAITEKGRRFVAGKRRLVRNEIKKNLSTLSIEEVLTLSKAIETFRQIIARVDNG
jgi:DNA-binding MarR family transcriptional regulator